MTRKADPQTRVIDGVHFEVAPLGYAVQRRLFVRLARDYGPAALQALTAAPSLRALMGGAGVAEALTKALEGLTEAFLEELADLFGECTRAGVDGKHPYLSTPDARIALWESQGPAGLLLSFKWLAFALEVNYAPFFSALAAQKDGAPAGAAPRK